MQGIFMSSAPTDPCDPNVDKAGIKNGWMDIHDLYAVLYFGYFTVNSASRKSEVGQWRHLVVKVNSFYLRHFSFVFNSSDFIVFK